MATKCITFICLLLANIFLVLCDWDAAENDWSSHYVDYATALPNTPLGQSSRTWVQELHRQMIDARNAAEKAAEGDTGAKTTDHEQTDSGNYGQEISAAVTSTHVQAQLQLILTHVIACDESRKVNRLAVYRPGEGKFGIAQINIDVDNSPVYLQGDLGHGIGGYDLKSFADRAFAYDYDHSGNTDHIALYRPGTGTIWILKNKNWLFVPVYQQGDPGSGIGGYDLKSRADRAFPYDYDHSGRMDHIVLYRPGTGTIWILKNKEGTFSPVYAEGDPGVGIGGYDLLSPTDKVFAFDYDHSGKLDHIVLYRPGTGTMWILKNMNGTFSPVYAEGCPGTGIGGYDLLSPADRAFAYDFDHTGMMDHIVLYRPGTGTIWILKNNEGTFSPVYQQGDPGVGIGGYDLASPADRLLAHDYDQSGKKDHIALYRPGTWTLWILKNNEGTFSPVFQEDDPGVGFRGIDPASPADRMFEYEFDRSSEYCRSDRPADHAEHLRLLYNFHATLA